jgi:hypothetical protein
MAASTLAAGTAEESLVEIAARQPAQSPGQRARQIRHVALQHRRTAAQEFVLHRGDNRGVVVAGIVHAVAGQEIEDAPSVGRVQFRAGARFVSRIHLQQVQHPHPLRVHMRFV